MIERAPSIGRTIRTLSVLVVASFVLACGDGCGCAGPDRPRLTVPEADSSLGSTFEVGVETGSSDTELDTSSPHVSDAGYDEVLEGSAEPSGPHQVAPADRVQRVTPAELRIRPIELQAPRRLPNRIAPTVVNPQIRRVGVSPSGPQRAVDPAVPGEDE